VSRAQWITPNDVGRLGVTWAALMSALLAFVLGVAGAAALLVALSSPDPFTPSSGASGPRAKTLGELAPVMLGAPFLVGVAIALGLVSRALWRSEAGSAARVWRSVARWAGGLFVLAGVLVAGNWLIERGSVLRTADCGTFRFSAASWRSGDVAQRVAAADGVARCGVVARRTRAGVVALLGAGGASAAGAAPLVYDLDARTPSGDRLVLRLDFAGGHVVRGAVVPA
jgi:hypothetical protein